MSMVRTQAPLGSGRSGRWWLVLLYLTIAALLAAVVWLWGGGSSDAPAQAQGQDSRSSTEPTAVSSAEPSVSTTDSEAVSEQSKKRLNRRVHGFVEAYFTRDAQLTEDQHRANIAPFVTGGFMEQYYRFSPLPDGVEKVEVQVGESISGTIEMPEEEGVPVRAHHVILLTAIEHRTDGSIARYEGGRQSMIWELSADGWRLAGF